MGEPISLPSVSLEEGAMYWVKPRYGDHADRWTVARWEVGCFWEVGGNEVSPAIISGPIPRPAENSPGVSLLGDKASLPPDDPNSPLQVRKEGS